MARPDEPCAHPGCPERSHFRCNRCSAIACAKHRQYAPSPLRAAKVTLGIFDTLRRVDGELAAERSEDVSAPEGKERQSARLRAFEREAGLWVGPAGQQLELVCFGCYREVYSAWLARQA